MIPHDVLMPLVALVLNPLAVWRCHVFADFAREMWTERARERERERFRGREQSRKRERDR